MSKTGLETHPGLALEAFGFGRLTILSSGRVALDPVAVAAHGEQPVDMAALLAAVDEGREALERGLGALRSATSDRRFEGRYVTRAGRRVWLVAALAASPAGESAPAEEVPVVHALLRDVTRSAAPGSEGAGETALSEALEVLIGMASHDLRSPLQTIRTGTTLLQEFERIDDDARRVIRRIDEAGIKAARLVGDFFDCAQARIHGGLPIRAETCDLLEIAKDAAKAQGSRSGGTQVVARGVPARLHGDRGRLLQAVANLIEHASGQREKGAEVFADVRLEGGEALATVSAQAAKPPAGAPAPDPFELGRPGEKTSGRHLGLHVVKLVAEAHRGSVRAAREPTGVIVYELRVPRAVPMPSTPGDGASSCSP